MCDVDVDVALGVVRLEEEELGNDDVGDIVIDRRPEEDDPVHEEPGKDVVGALTAAGALDDVGRINGRHVFLFLSFRHCSKRHSSPAAT